MESFFVAGESAEAKKARHSELFRELKSRVENDNKRNLLKPRDSMFFLSCLLVHVLILGTIYVAFHASGVLQWSGVGFLTGVAFVWTGMLGHDIGHYQVLGKNPSRGDLLRWYLGNLCLGVAWSWWVAKHFKHHTTPNQLGEDPDVQFDWIAFTKEQLAEKGQDKVTQFLLRNEWWLFWLYLPFQAMNASRSSIQTLRREDPRRSDFKFQMAGIVTHWVIYFCLLACVGLFVGWREALSFFAFSQGTHGMYNSLVFATNHKGMKAYLKNETPTFLEFQILTSRDVRGYWWLPEWAVSWIYGGLNHQVAHHLFPKMPRCNLGRAQKIIEAFCIEKGIPYYQTTIPRAYWEVGHNFREVVRDLVDSPMGA